MKKKLVLLTMTVLLMAALAGGATMALFTDTAANAGNTFTAGTVDIYAHRALGDPIPGPIFYTTDAEGIAAPGQDPLHPTGVWWPGRTVSRNLSVRNPGSLQVRLHQVSAEITSINGLPPAANPALAASFAGNMRVKISVASHPHLVLYDGLLAALLTGPRVCVHKPVISPLAAGLPFWRAPGVGLIYEVTMLSSAGNDLQGIRPVVSFNVFAEQTRNN